MLAVKIIMTTFDKYLSFLWSYGKSKIKVLSSIKERVIKKVTGWKAKLFLKARKKTIIKAIA